MRGHLPHTLLLAWLLLLLFLLLTATYGQRAMLGQLTRWRRLRWLAEPRALPPPPAFRCRFPWPFACHAGACRVPGAAAPHCR